MCQQIDYAAIMIVREMAFCVKVKTIFSEIYPYKNVQKVLAFRTIELNLTY